MSSELIRMFRYPSMIKSAAFCAATFGLLAVVFKNSVVLIPEVSEIRLCNILAVVYGLYFGPAGAWGCLVGNLIGDMAGSLTVLSWYGGIANFLSAYLPYKLWCVLGATYGESPLARPSVHSPKLAVRLILACIVSVVPCVALLSGFFDVHGTMPAANTFAMLGLNNTGATVLGAVLFLVASRIPARVLPYWRTLMDEETDRAFDSRHGVRMYVIAGISVLLAIAMVGYMLVSGLSLTVMDEFGNVAIIAAELGCVLVMIVLAASCQWKVREQADAVDTGIIEL